MQGQSESPAQMSPISSQFFEPVFSGDEADTDDHRRHRTLSQMTGVAARDFEADKPSTESSKGNSKKRMKKVKKSKRKKKERVTEEGDEKTGNASNLVASRKVEVTFADQVQETPDAAASKGPFNIRNISSAVRPALSKGLSSTVFVHHEATGRSLPMPLPLPRSNPMLPTSSGDLRRTSSLPENLHIITSVPTSALTLPHLLPANQPQAIVGSNDIVEEQRHLSRTSAVILLICSTGLVAICAEFLVDSINYLVENSGVSQAFIGLIILPIVGNAAEHVTAVTVAAKNKMDLAINVALGSSIQIALFVTPIIVLLGWCLNTDMSLYFSLFETISLFASTFIVSYLVIDGRSNYLEGVLLIAAYVIIAVASFFYPSCGLSVASGAADSTSASC
jgi:Ca2+:H+ antiporter